MNKMKLDEVNTNEFIFRKILIGDSGDNVSPLDVKIKISSKDNSQRRFVVTENQANQVLDEFKSDKVFVNQSHFFNDEYIDQIVKIAKRIIKIEKPENEIRAKWELNRNLVYLHKKAIPEKVLSDMFNHIEPNKLHAFSALELHSIMDKEKILVGTTYTKEKAESFNESSIFKAAMPKANEKAKSDVVITSTPSDKGFDDSFWKDLLK
jgi:hypothetical protein